jgi:hypothetical protein
MPKRRGEPSSLGAGGSTPTEMCRSCARWLGLAGEGVTGPIDLGTGPIRTSFDAFFARLVP